MRQRLYSVKNSPFALPQTGCFVYKTASKRSSTAPLCDIMNPTKLEIRIPRRHEGKTTACIPAAVFQRIRVYPDILCILSFERQAGKAFFPSRLSAGRSSVRKSFTEPGWAAWRHEENGGKCRQAFLIAPPDKVRTEPGWAALWEG